jgi:5'-nucleotidase
MRILVTNDDGIRAKGIQTLKEALEPLGTVWVVAPDREQSAASHALTLSRPLRITRHGPREFSVDGTPTDCVLVAIKGVDGLVEPKPDIVLSGINHGPNMGEDVTYSGTVSAAIEGRLLGRPSVALSMVAWEPNHFETAGRVALGIVKMIQSAGLPGSTLLNVNVPDCSFDEIRGVRVTKLGNRVYRDAIIPKTDPRGKPYYWIGGEDPEWEDDDQSDFNAVQEGFISMTPMRLDLTDYRSMVEMSGWEMDGILRDV